MSGLWEDMKITSPEDQQKILLPLNHDTEHLYYGQRVIYDNKVQTEPRTWVISKVNRTQSNGIVLFTMAQDQFNEHTDYIERDEYGKIIGMWADYFKSGITPTSSNEYQPKIYSEITYTGVTPQLKVGGSYKKFTVSFFDDGEPIDFRDGEWSYSIDGIDAKELVQELRSIDTEENQIKIKFLGNDSYIGQNIVISYTSSDKIKSSVEMNIVGL